MSVSNLTVAWPYKTVERHTWYVPGQSEEPVTYAWSETKFVAAWYRYGADLHEFLDIAFITPPENLSSLLPQGAQVIMIAFMLDTHGSDTSQSGYTDIYVNPGAQIPSDAATAIAWANPASSTYVCPVPKGRGEYPCGTADASVITGILEKGVFVRVTTRGITAQATPSYITTQITYLDPTKAPVAAITEPADKLYHKTEEPLTVSWSYYQEAESPQTGATIEGSLDEAIWVTLGTVSGTDTTYTIPADTLTAGNWKLRLTVTSASASSEPVTINAYMRSSPATSNVTCDGLPHPTVSWTGVDQTAYQVRFGTWDSGARFGTETSLTVPRVFDNDTYPVTVRTQTSNGEWSAWSETVWVEVANNDAGMTTTLTVTQSAAAALCSWTAVAGSVGYILLRDGEPIYAGTTPAYRDNAVTGTAAYTVRVLAASGYYTDNGPVTFALALRCDVMLPLDDDTAEWIPLRYSLAPRSRSYDRSAGVTMRYYAGREKPIAVSNGTNALTMRTTCAFKRRADAEALMMMTGRPVLYKDYNGGKIIGIINPVGYDSERVYSVDISVTEIDWPDNLDAEIAALYAAVADTIRAVNPVTETRVQALITSTGSWGNPSAAGRAWMLAVPAGSEKLRLTAVKTANFVAYLTSATVATSGTPAYATGESGRHEVSVGQNLLTLPSDCTYVYVAIRNTSGWIIPKNAQFEGDYAVQSE